MIAIGAARGAFRGGMKLWVERNAAALAERRFNRAE
jgi:hypothetical protein